MIIIVLNFHGLRCVFLNQILIMSAKVEMKEFELLKGNQAVGVVNGQHEFGNKIVSNYFDESETNLSKGSNIKQMDPKLGFKFDNHDDAGKTSFYGTVNIQEQDRLQPVLGGSRQHEFDDKTRMKIFAITNVGKGSVSAQLVRGEGDNAGSISFGTDAYEVRGCMEHTFGFGYNFP